MIVDRSIAIIGFLAMAVASGPAAAHGHSGREDVPAASQGSSATVVTVPGMPAVIDPANLYSETAAGRLSPVVEGALERVYVPNRLSNSISVIDPATLKVVDVFAVGHNPQHVVPSWDLKTLWVANNAEGRTDGSLTPIDPRTGKPGRAIPVDDPYNVYWSPNGRYAIIVAEALKRLDFRDATTLKLEFTIATPECAGINHGDFSVDGSFAAFTCEFDGAITKIDLVNRKVADTIVPSPHYDRPEVVTSSAAPRGKKSGHGATDSGGAMHATKGMPQDIRISPDGRVFFVADMMADGVHVIDAASFRQIGFIPTDVGAHGLYPSRDGKLLYVPNRGSNKVHGPPGGKGSVSVIEFATRRVAKTWPIPGGGSPDMGNFSADGRYLWLSGRFDDTVYRIDSTSGGVDKIKVGREPHGLTVWPQPGRYSLGHTGNLR